MVDVVAQDPDSFAWGGTSGPSAGIERIRAACAEADGQDPLDEAAVLHLKHHGLSDASLWMVDESGFALLHKGSLHLAVAPTTRGCGFGAALLTAAIGASSGPIDAWSHGNHPAAATLAGSHGFDRVRDLWVMRRPTWEAALPDLADGTPIRSFRPGDEAELLRVNAAAFAHHPEQGAMDAADLAARMAEPWFDPAGLLIAEEDGEMLGFHWTKQHSPRTGEVYVVGISPDAQGKGLGKRLTLAGLHHLAGLGVDEVILYVESDNAPAVAVYSRLGFTHADSDTHVMYRRG